MKQILQQPYPLTLFQDRKREILFGITSFILGFQLIFQPFHFRFYPLDDKMLVLLAYAIVSVSVLSINLWIIPRTFPKWFSKETWFLWKEMLWVSWNIFGIATGIFVFKISFGYYGFTLAQIFHGVLAALAVGMIPALIYELLVFFPLGLRQKVSSPPKNTNLQRQTANNQLITFQAERNQNAFSLNPTDIIFVTSEKNYLIFYFLHDGALVEKKLRNRMYYAEEKLRNFGQFFRCHRAFIVNLKMIEELQISAHGGKLVLKSHYGEIPVSRRFVADLKDYFKGKNQELNDAD